MKGNIRLWIENTAAMHILRNGMSRSSELRREVNKLYHQYPRVAERMICGWIPSVLNLFADQASRRDAKGECGCKADEPAIGGNGGEPRSGLRDQVDWNAGCHPTPAKGWKALWKVKEEGTEGFIVLPWWPRLLETCTILTRQRTGSLRSDTGNYIDSNWDTCIGRLPEVKRISFMDWDPCWEGRQARELWQNSSQTGGP